MTVLLLSLALSLNPSTQTPTPPPPPKAQIHTYTAGTPSYDANAFWLESDSGLVLIDALLLKSEARLLVASMKSTGKPLAGIILTHPHLDHFGGVRTVVSAYGGKIPVFATRATADGIGPAHQTAMAAGWPQGFGDDYDLGPFLPDRIVESGAILELAGMRFMVRDYGPIEAANNSVIHSLDLNVLFTGDATVAHAAVYVGEGHSRNALEMLPKLAADFPSETIAYSGHYGPMLLEPLVAQNLEEIRYYRGLARMQVADPASLSPEGQLTKAARGEAARAMASHIREGSTYGLSPFTLALMNLASLEKEMLAEPKDRPAHRLRGELVAGLKPLKFLNGRWKGEVTAVSPAPVPSAPPLAPLAPTAPAAPTQTTIEVSFRPGLGGRSLEGAARLAGFSYQMLVAYDAYQKSYRTSVIDDVSGLIDVYEGAIDESGSLVQSNVRPGTYYLRNTDKIHTRLTFRPLPKGLWEWLIDESRDDGATWARAQAFVAESRMP